jgi:hypothetical protein
MANMNPQMYSNPYGPNYFRPVKTDTARRAMEYFDQDGNGKLDQDELQWGARVLNYFGHAYNPAYGDIGNLFTRLSRTLDQDPTRIDKDGDGTISYVDDNTPNGFVAPKQSELTQLAKKDGNSTTVTPRDVPHVWQYNYRPINPFAM